MSGDWNEGQLKQNLNAISATTTSMQLFPVNSATVMTPTACSATSWILQCDRYERMGTPCTLKLENVQNELRVTENLVNLLKLKRLKTLKNLMKKEMKSLTFLMTRLV